MVRGALLAMGSEATPELLDEVEALLAKHDNPRLEARRSIERLVSRREGERIAARVLKALFTTTNGG